MSVLKKDQKETDVFFLMCLRELCVEAASTLEKRKKDKFYNAFAPVLYDNIVKAYVEAQLANNIVISKTDPIKDLSNRRGHFQMTLGHLDTYENIVQLYVNTAIANKSFNEQKAYNFMRSNGDKLAKIRSSIVRIIKNDISKARKLEKKRIEETEIIRLNSQCQWYNEQVKLRKETNKIIQPIIFFK